MQSPVKTILVGISFAVLLSGCAMLGSAYQSASDTVSGWFKSDDKKDQKK